MNTFVGKKITLLKHQNLGEIPAGGAHMWLVKTKPSYWSEQVLGDFFEDFASTTPATYQQKLQSKLVDQADKYELTVAVPGVNKKDIAVTYLNDVLTLKINQQSKSEAEDKKNIEFSEFSLVNSQRDYQISDIDSDKINADLSNGLLTIHLPKKPQEQAKEIPIK